jgi:hypothetical protein
MTTRKSTTVRRHRRPPPRRRRIEEIGTWEIIETFLVAMIIVGAMGWVILDSIHRGEALRPEWTKPHHAATACFSDDGSGPVHPCLWDALTMGNRQMGPGAARYTMFDLDENGEAYAYEWWGGKAND